ncbi:hypothetical protein [Caballeronia sp. KNU42]
MKPNTWGKQGANIKTTSAAAAMPKWYAEVVRQNGTISIRDMRRLLIAAMVLTLTAYLTRNTPLDVEAVTLSRFGLDIGKLDD